MNLKEYQEEVKRTCATDDPMDTIKMACIGLPNEVGEMLGPIKKYLFHSHSLDCKHVEEEMGDTLWYLATLANLLHIDMGEVINSNVDKLQKRYPEGFDQERSRNRV